MRLTLVKSSLIACSFAALSACTFVTNADWQEKVDCLDEDQDGAVRADSCPDPDVEVDCDDNNRDRAPSLPEIPYDGIDNDCNGADIVDVDSDGYPGITQADWVSNDGVTTYPTGLQASPDCDDAEPSVHPTAAETYYDGVDSNCDGADDWDADGDGYVIRADLLGPGDQPYPGVLPGGDCDDNNVNTNPGRTAAEDDFYDGVDTNCDGVNDFDADGDGQMPVEPATGQLSTIEEDFSVFVERFGYEGQFDAVFTDCNDDDATIYAGAPDTFYDNIDSDCAGDDDYDQDLDGFVLRADLRPSGSPPYEGNLPESDCVDTDALVFPGQLESLGDLVDSDCDGGADTAPFVLSSSHGFENLRPPVAGAIDGMYLLMSAVDAITVTNGTRSLNAGFVLRFPWEPEVAGGPLVPPTNGEVPLIPMYWEFAAQGVISHQFDVEFRSDRFFLAHSQRRSFNGAEVNNLRMYRFVAGSNNNFPDQVKLQDGYGVSDAQYTSVDIEEDENGDWVAAGCADGVVHLKMARSVGSNWTGVFDNDAVLTGVSSELCAVQPLTALTDRPDARVYGFGPNQTNFALDGSGEVVVDTPATDPLLGQFTTNSVVNRDGLLTLTGTTPGGAVPMGVSVIEDGGIIGVYLTGDEVLWASSMFNGPDLYVAAVVADRDGDNKDDLVLLYGDPSSPTEVEVPVLDDDGLPATLLSASLWADSDRVMLGVAVNEGELDRLGWSFLAPAE